MTPGTREAAAGEGDDRRYLWFDTTNRMLTLATKQRVPIIGNFELTARCNLSCGMCYVRREASDPAVRAGERRAAEWLEVARQALEEGTLFLLLTGGEPLLKSDFWELYDPLCRMGFFLTLFTNATLVGEREAAAFARRPPSRVVVTLYGASPETYGKVCGDPSAYHRAMAGVRRLVAAGVRTEVRATISRDNVGDLKALRELGRELTGREDIDVCMMLTRAVRGACTRPEEKRVTPAEVAARRVSEIDCESVRAAPKEAAVSVVRNSGAAPSPMFCAGGRGSFWIAWDGRMLPCALMDRPFTQPFQEGFAPAWRRLTAETDTIPGAAACGTCEHRPYCSVCPGRLQAETGSFAEVAPYVCEVARRLHEAAGIAYQG